jgi:hypothetical protein
MLEQGLLMLTTVVQLESSSSITLTLISPSKLETALHN